MTDEQKEILIAKMLDAPSTLSDQDLNMIQHDEELKDIYEVSSAISGATMPQPELDMEKEWNLFRPRIRRWRSPSRWIMKVAAIFLGVLALGGITGKIIDYMLTTENQPLVAIAKQPVSKIKEINPKPEYESIEKGITEESVVNKESKSIIPHRKRVKAESTISEEATENNIIDIDELIRIEQAKIDNDIAVITAQQIIVDYNELLLNVDMNEIDNEQMIQTINMLTMQ